MREQLMNMLEVATGALTLQDIILNFLVAGLLGITIFLSYRLSHAGPVYSASFNVSLVMLTLVTTLVMNVIGNNIALSLGMVGALSIVRFRTAIKDPRDTTYIFWGIAVGICCGVQEYLISSLGSAVIFLFMLIFGVVKSNDRFLLVVRGVGSGEEAINKAVQQLFGSKATIRVRNTTSTAVELIFEISQKQIQLVEKQSGSVTAALNRLEDVTAANLVSQNDEINR